MVLFMDNCAEFLECLFACWAAGLVAVPVNSKLHPREVADIARDCGARLMIATRSVAGNIDTLAPEPRHSDNIICTDEKSYRLLSKADPIACQIRKPEDFAWIFYTSGTTGRPKGATLTHRNLLSMAYCYYADVAFLDERDTAVHAAPLSHGSGLCAVSHMLRGGHQLVLPGFDTSSVFDAIGAYPNVSMFAAPTMVTRLVASGEAHIADTRNFKTLYYGGGPMYVSDLKEALSVFGPKLFQLYGQGESPMTIAGLSQRAHADIHHPRYIERLGSCGLARTGVSFKIVDGEDRELPVGEAGEIITRSDCVMTGYWRNEQATAETLRNGWLHTGDIGSVDADGYLTLRDRSKDMIISGGTNIYPREVEEVLLAHPAVVECAVVGRAHPDWGEEVVAFVVPRPDVSVEPSELDRLCLDQIARFKRPKHYLFVECLPKNNYGKVLKTVLRERLREEQEAP